MNRRSFISGLIRVGACVAFDPHRVIFDMGRRLWIPESLMARVYHRDGGPPVGAIYYGQAYAGAPFVELHRVNFGPLDCPDINLDRIYDGGRLLKFSAPLPDPLEWPALRVAPKPEF